MHRSGVFISYSNYDRKWLESLRVHLSYLEKEHRFTIWDDSKIRPGSDWRHEIKHAISSARVAVMLVSAHYISSDFIGQEEIPPLLAAAKEDGALIFPLIVSHCMFGEIEALSRFQAINPVSKPLTAMEEAERDALFVKLTKEIKLALVSGTGRKQAPSTRKLNGAANDGISLVKQSIARACVLFILSNNRHQPNGLTISDIFAQSKTRSRKNVFQSIQEMEDSKLIIRQKNGKTVNWKLTEEGERLADEMRESVIFR